MKLNLGCGSTKLEGYTNLDKYDVFNPDVLHDLEICPWPFDDNSVSYVIAHHIMEHLGETSIKFMNILAELYRICKPKTILDIRVPHYNCWIQYADPTHVRSILPEMFDLFDGERHPDSNLYLSTGLNFKVLQVEYIPVQPYQLKIDAKEMTLKEVIQLSNHQVNIIAEYHMLIEIVKNET